jgi:hypothetical protein
MDTTSHRTSHRPLATTRHVPSHARHPGMAWIARLDADGLPSAEADALRRQRTGAA